MHRRWHGGGVMKDRGAINILDALENLNTLVDAKSLDEIEVTDDSLLISHKEEGNGVFWIKAGPDEQTLVAIRNTFRSVHTYLQTFYSRMKSGGDTKRLVEGINTIMVLVGESVKNLEKIGLLFAERVSDIDEYKELQHFYKNRVIKESFKEFAMRPMPKVKPTVEKEEQQEEEELKALLEEDEVEEVAGVHILNDIEVIKRDHHYELFYLKNEAGAHFYSWQLARTIKLACDFGEYSKEYFGEDPLLQIKNWEDKSLHILANTILKKCHVLTESFYKEALKYREMDVVAGVHNALMALMLCSNPRNMIRQFSLKGCHLYFHDFLIFLRETLNNREYQKFVVYSSPQSKPFFQVLIDLVHALCYNLFTSHLFDDELKGSIKQMVERSEPKAPKHFSEMLLKAHEALIAALKMHPNGPVFKAVDIIRDEEEYFFDPLIQGNIPSKEWVIQRGEHAQTSALRMPCPIQQEMINKAYVTAEFKTFLSTMNAKESLLFINYQDRTSWKEHARSVAMEELGTQAEFAHAFQIVTLAKDTDFYNQSGYYEDIEEAADFLELFEEHLGDEATGYYFPPKIKKLLFPKFIQDLLPQIHATFFAHKKRLSFMDRLDFIQLTYHFIELKLLELIKPTYVSFGSKDGLDISGAASVGMIALLSLDKGKKFNEEEQDRLNTLLFGPTLINRERSIHPERFTRLLSLVALLEHHKNYLKAFSHLFEKDTLKWSVDL